MMHWKLRRDPYLAPLSEKYGEEAAWAAGFFLDEDPEDARLDDTEWLCTPRPKRAVQGSQPVVLLATGGFCPVHSGHLEMMESARVAAERAGLEVVGGYLSPGHDAYLRMKCGPAAVPAQQRLRQCAQAVAGSAWLSVDPWEAMHCRVAVNYTDVTARLQAYLQKHVDARIEVVYVCGADNARFANAFSERGRCVVVGRPGGEAELERWRLALAGHPRVLWSEGHNAAASRELRAAAAAPAPRRPRLVIRVEDNRAVRTLGLASLREFQAALVELLGRYADVRTAPVALAEHAPDTISLDAMLPAEHNIAISRVFAPGGYESLGHTHRPLSPPLAQQIASIPAGKYGLWDDDQITGDTIRAVLSLLPPSVVVERRAFAIEHDADEEVVDARDFLLGADDGGLVLALPGGGSGRAPYLLPYVDPAERASIAQSHQFSIDVWELNARTFAPTKLTIQDLPEPARATFAFPGSARLADVCSWHAERLKHLRFIPGN